jgi:hypothetical protein
MTLNTFDEVVSWYNRTAPIRGKRKAWDLRPIGARKRWWERIVKIDDNTYALHDGWDYCSYREGFSEEILKKQKAEIRDVAPILWMRRKGADYVRIRSCINYNGGISRYAFLNNYLPAGLTHGYKSDGVHWIQTNNKRYLLSFMKRDWTPGVNTEDNYLEFNLADQKFVLVNEPLKKRVRVVHREITKQYNPKIKEMWQWAQAVMPILGDQVRDVMVEQLKALGMQAHRGIDDFPAPFVRKCLENAEGYENMRYALMVTACMESGNVLENLRWAQGGGTYTSRFKDEGKKSYDRFRKVMHKHGDMLTTKEVDFE